jgi:endonuclease/exonuclease/phosphatase family metal-dependent hydrolase
LFFNQGPVNDIQESTMQTSNSARLIPALSIALYALLSLFLLQLLSEFVEAVYAFGLLNTNIPPELVSVLVLLSPLLLLLFPDGIQTSGLMILGELAVLCRAVEVLLDTRGRMLVSGVGVGSLLLFFPALLLHLSSHPKLFHDRLLALGLLVGVSLSIALRAAGSGSDPSLASGSPLLAWLLALAAGGLLLGSKRLFIDSPQEPAGGGLQPPGLGHTCLLALGIDSVWILGYFALSAPNVIARWTGGSYLWTVALAAAASFAGALLLGRENLVGKIPSSRLTLLSLLFTASLALTTLAQQQIFPHDPSAYPLAGSSIPWWGNFAWPVFLLFSALVGLDYARVLRTLLARPLSARRLGVAFGLASLFLLIMIFAQVFTTVYDYIPVIGPLFRDKFWMVISFPALILTLSTLGARSISPMQRQASSQFPAGIPAVASTAMLALASIAAVLVNRPQPPIPPSDPASLRILTYNIQQGYSASGQKAYPQQMAVLAQSGADLIGLQESDTNRISGGNTDLVRYYSDHLSLYSNYGPSTVTGTFGIALLSRYPLETGGNAYLYSSGEQTAILHARAQVGGEAYQVFVTHLGNNGPPIQQAEVLDLVRETKNVILMGDFNFTPETPQYLSITAVLDDAWVRAGEPGAPGFDPRKRIDYIFVSPNLNVLNASYHPGPQSDHPWLAAEVR